MILKPEHRWECPSCDFTDVTHEARPHTQFHTCRGLKGLTAPMVPAGTKAKHETREREDWVGSEHVTLDGDGRPVMSIVTTRDDGQDCTVFAPLATGKANEL